MFKRNREIDPLDELITRVQEEMIVYGPDHEEYEKWLRQLERLTELKQSNKREFKVSPDVMAGILGNMAGIVMIISYERANVMNSKAMTFIGRNRT